MVLAAPTAIALAGAGIGPARAAQGYVVAEVDVTDASGYQTYIDRTTPIAKSFGGRLVVRGGRTVAVAGEPPKRVAP